MNKNLMAIYSRNEWQPLAIFTEEHFEDMHRIIAEMRRDDRTKLTELYIDVYLGGPPVNPESVDKIFSPK